MPIFAIKIAKIGINKKYFYLTAWQGPKKKITDFWVSPKKINAA
jgi:hypothetical protein